MPNLRTYLGGGFDTMGGVVPVNRRRNPNRPVRPLPRGRMLKGGGHEAPGGSAPSTPGAAADPSQPTAATPAASNPTDPVLERIRALARRSIDTARSQGLADRRQAIVESGLADVGAEYGLDTNTVQAARENPFSERARLERMIQEQTRDAENAFNEGNLYYSGARIRGLGDIETERAGQQASLAQRIRARMAEIAEEERQAEEEANDAILDAELEAAMNAPAPEEPEPLPPLWNPWGASPQVGRWQQRAMRPRNLRLQLLR